MDNLTWFSKALIVIALNVVSAFFVMLLFPLVTTGTISYGVAMFLTVVARITPSFVGFR